MIVECPKCKKKYKVDKASIPPGGAPVRCPECSNIFTVFTEPVDIKLDPVIEETVTASDTGIISEPETFAPQLENSESLETSTPVDTGTPTDLEENVVPTTEDRTKLWEKLQQTYKSEKKDELTPQEPAIEESPTTETAFAEETKIEPEEEQIQETVSQTTPVETPLIEQQPETLTEEVETIEEIIEGPETEEQKTEKEAKRLARSLVKDILLYHGDKVEIGLKQGNLAHLIGDEIRKSWKYYKDSFPLEKTGGVNFFKNALNEIIGKGKPIFK